MFISTRTSIFILIICIATKTYPTTARSCPSDSYPHTSEDDTILCCKKCPAGTHVVSHCQQGNASTCRKCPDNHFYEKSNQNTRCLRCNKCPQRMVMKDPCNSTADTFCICQEGYYYRSFFPACSRCTSCRIGHGIVQDCTHWTKRMCEICVQGETFTDKENSKCRKCSQCGINEVKVANCTVTKDTLCKQVTEKPMSSSMKMTITICAVTLGVMIVAIVAICVVSRKTRVRWCCTHASAKRSASGQSDLPLSSGGVPRSVPEESKLLTVDIESKAGCSHQSSSREEVPCDPDKLMDVSELGYEVKEKLARLLDPKSLFGKNWKSLAGLMKYTQIDIANFNTNDDSPTLQLLLDCSTHRRKVKELHDHFKRMNREDCAELVEPHLMSTTE